MPIVRITDLQSTGTAADVAESARILVVDDQADNVQLLADLLSIHGYTVETALSGQGALACVERRAPDLILLDVVMPGLSGLQVLRRLRADARFAVLPIVLVTALDPDVERVNGLEAGADDFLAKPINGHELLARVRSLVRVKRLFDRIEAQSAELRRLNDDLERRVATKVAEVERLSRLKRFLAPQVAARVAGDAQDSILASHRTDIAVVFFDLRGFTAFSERSEPEDVLRVLREFHHAIGTQSQRFSGTIERFVGDGAMVFFNDPEPVPDPCVQAARFALAVFEACEQPLARWRREGFDLHIGSGLAYGYATLGAVGFSDRYDYAVVGTVANLASRLCGEARGGDIIVSARAAAALTDSFSVQPIGPLTLKGFRDPVEAFRLSGAR
ncbi:MAG TPA: response regulator [Burkholderiales bacterium]|nr:response regulator [Burkholderiales bacterium]